MWNTGKIDLALHSALPGMCAMSSFEVGLVSRELLTTSAFHGGPAFRHVARHSDTRVPYRARVQCLPAAASAGKMEGRYSFFFLFLQVPVVSFRSIDFFGIYLYGSSTVQYCTRVYALCEISTFFSFSLSALYKKRHSIPVIKICSMEQRTSTSQSKCYDILLISIVGPWVGGRVCNC